jgi:carbon-monoxide dehydrogenase small subunit
MVITITVNEKKITKQVHPARRLLDFLRYDLFLTGTKEGCGEGECGACTVLIDEKPVNSCLVLTAQVQNRSIMTIEGIRETEIGKNLISAFTELGAIQCGFCTTGLIVVSYSIVKNSNHISISDIRNSISGNLCRCTGYEKIIEAIAHVVNIFKSSVIENK